MRSDQLASAVAAPGKTPGWASSWALLHCTSRRSRVPGASCWSQARMAQRQPRQAPRAPAAHTFLVLGSGPPHPPPALLTLLKPPGHILGSPHRLQAGDRSSGTRTCVTTQLTPSWDSRFWGGQGQHLSALTTVAPVSGTRPRNTARLQSALSDGATVRSRGGDMALAQKSAHWVRGPARPPAGM